MENTLEQYLRDNFRAEFLHGGDFKLTAILRDGYVQIVLDPLGRSAKSLDASVVGNEVTKGFKVAF